VLNVLGVGTLIIGLLVPSNDEGLKLDSGTAASSPFVIAIKRAGIKGLPSVRNGCFCPIRPSVQLNFGCTGHQRVFIDVSMVSCVQ